MNPPRRRKRDLDLPQRIYRHHGHYRLVKPDGSVINLGKRKADAPRRLQVSVFIDGP